MKSHELQRVKFNEDLPVSISKHTKVQSKIADEAQVIIYVLFLEEFYFPRDSCSTHNMWRRSKFRRRK